MFSEILVYNQEKDSTKNQSLLYEAEIRYGIGKMEGEYPDFHIKLNGITRFAINQNKNGDILSVIYFVFEDNSWAAEYIGQKYVIGWVDFSEKEVQEIIENLLRGKIKYAFGFAYEKIISRNPDQGEEHDRPDNA
jgi:hypothetical protein